ncbi:hypothetical protein ACHAWF_016020 [Thalassiosira exigua]
MFALVILGCRELGNYNKEGPPSRRRRGGIICGSGLPGVSNALDDNAPEVAIPYPDRGLAVGTLRFIPAI